MSLQRNYSHVLYCTVLLGVHWESETRWQNCTCTVWSCYSCPVCSLGGWRLLPSDTLIILVVYNAVQLWLSPKCECITESGGQLPRTIFLCFAGGERYITLLTTFSHHNGLSYSVCSKLKSDKVREHGPREHGGAAARARMTSSGRTGFVAVVILQLSGHGSWADNCRWRETICVMVFN